jgi:hypothetical protein
MDINAQLPSRAQKPIYQSILALIAKKSISKTTSALSSLNVNKNTSQTTPAPTNAKNHTSQIINAQ